MTYLLCNNQPLMTLLFLTVVLRADFLKPKIFDLISLHFRFTSDYHQNSQNSYYEIFFSDSNFGIVEPVGCVTVNNKI